MYPEDYRRLARERESMIDEMVDLRKDRNRLLEDAQAARAELERCQRALDAARRDADLQRKENEGLAQSNERFRRELDDLRHELEEREAGHKAALRRLEETLRDEARREQDALANRIEGQAAARLGQAQQEIDRLLTIARELRSDRDELQIEVERLHQALIRRHRELDAAEGVWNDAEELRRRYARAQQERDRLLAERDHREDTIGRQAQQIQHLIFENDRLVDLLNSRPPGQVAVPVPVQGPPTVVRERVPVPAPVPVAVPSPVPVAVPAPVPVAVPAQIHPPGPGQQPYIRMGPPISMPDAPAPLITPEPHTMRNPYPQRGQQPPPDYQRTMQQNRGPSAQAQ
eukprot:TRINITY_DN8230_c0_g1_i1.p1 TRINITY_DN8230_c0_g1~~TRINITY_DN8230_c0_g1_i1.p1  ORF type:complete len:345 (+),score=84.59 TRINITY_DN8230_c0_g1_i1:115-1149(+)